MEPPVEISEKALYEIKNLLNNKGIPADYGLRIGVRGAGCGFAFKLGFDKAKDNDEVYESGEVKIFIQKRELMFLIGKKIDFYDESDGRGFYFN